ncbi:MAG: Uma2 family endonuclease [Deltaproteobacteria bacterium]
MSALEHPGYVLRPLRRAEYERLVEAGAFESERVELLEGFLVERSPQPASHASAIEVLTDLLYSARQPGQKVRVQLPLALGDESEPAPDLCVVPAGDHRQRHPSGALLVIEVAESSLAKDRRKSTIYARAGVPEYWLVDVENQRVEVRTQPEGGAYLQQETVASGGELQPSLLPGSKVSVDRIFAG